MTTSLLSSLTSIQAMASRRGLYWQSLPVIAVSGLLIGTISASHAQLFQSPAPAPKSAQVTPPAQPAPRPKAAAPATPAPAASTPAAQPAAPANVVRNDADVVARIAGRDVTIGEVRAFVAGLNGEQQAALARDPALLSQSLRLMLANQLVLKEATDKKWQDQPAVAAQLARVRDNAVVEMYLQTASVPPENYPDDAEIQKTYDANKSSFIIPRQFRLGQIFVASPAGAEKTAEDQARKKLSDIQARLKQPKADFGAIAKELSDQRDTGERAGELGWVAENQIRPEIKNQVMGLADNGVGEPIKLDDGWHIIKLMETKAASTYPLADVRALLVQRLRAQRAELLRRNYLARVLEQNPPAINELALGRVFGVATTATAPAR